MNKPHDALEFWTPDQCAECLDLSDDARRELWAALKDPNDVPGEGDDDGPAAWVADRKRSVVHVWGKLSPEVQTEVNRAISDEMLKGEG